MQSDTQIKTRSTLLTLAGLALAGVLSACGGGSESLGTVKQDNNAVIFPSVNPLNKYMGTYTDNKCWTGYLPTVSWTGKKFQMVLSASDKPNTLNFSETTFFYNNAAGAKCTVEVGSSTTFGELAYEGTLPSAEFSDSTKPPLQADKIQGSYTGVINKGLVESAFDELNDYENVKGLFALEGNTIYFGDTDFPYDAEGFPTRLYKDNFFIRQ